MSHFVCILSAPALQHRAPTPAERRAEVQARQDATIRLRRAGVPHAAIPRLLRRLVPTTRCACSRNAQECGCRTTDALPFGHMPAILCCTDCGALVERTCIHCGCTDAEACPGGCSWATVSECSACVPRLVY